MGRPAIGSITLARPAIDSIVLAAFLAGSWRKRPVARDLQREAA
jgi:hypothetical protein